MRKAQVLRRRGGGAFEFSRACGLKLLPPVWEPFWQLASADLG